MSVITSCVGRLGRDAILRKTEGGEPVLGFPVAVDVGFGDKKETLWFDCSGWGKRFAGVAAFLQKGVPVFVSGEQGERMHEGKAYKTLRLNDLSLVAPKPKG